MKYNIDYFKKIHIELSSYCNSNCYFCRRSESVNSNLINKNLSKQAIDNLLIPKLTKKLTLVCFCGNLGDPMMNPNIYYFLDKLMSMNSKVNVWFSTNGSMHDTEWWADFGKYTKDMDLQVAFCIDGIDKETNNYRNTSYEKVMSHMNAYINNGGTAEWRMIPFRHTEHLIEMIREKCKKFGIKFQIVKSWRYDSKFQKPMIMPKYDYVYCEKKCQFIHNKLFYVHATGYVDPCCYPVPYFYEFTHLSLEDYTIEEIMNDSRYKLLTLFVNKSKTCRDLCKYG